MFRVEKVLVVVLIAVLAGVLMYECLTPTGFLYPYLHREEEAPEHRRRLPFGLFDTASKVADSNSEWATAWVNQRKTFFDGDYFWVFYYYGYAPEVDPDYPYIYYAVSSQDGFSWSNPQGVVRRADIDYMYLGQGIDVRWDATLNKAIMSIPYNYYFYWARVGTSNGVLTREVLRCPLVYAGFYVVAPRHSYIEDYVLCYHQAVDPLNSFKRGDVIAYSVRDVDAGTPQAGLTSAGPFGTYSDVNGGSLTLRYDKDTAIYVVKDGDNTLHWGFMNKTFITFPPISLETELSPGLNSLSGCETELDSGIINQHIVYIKFTGELCYRRFENDVWSGETVLVEKGASYPVIAAGGGGRLYVFYVFNGVIKLLKFDGEKWLKNQVQDAFPFHTYNNPAYLSTNQVVQHGKICLVWTERNLVHGEKPYAVWFGYIEDG